jgi:hypothetical protein
MKAGTDLADGVFDTAAADLKQVYNVVTDTTAPLGDFWNENIKDPLASAATDTLSAFGRLEADAVPGALSTFYDITGDREKRDKMDETIRDMNHDIDSGSKQIVDVAGKVITSENIVSVGVNVVGDMYGGPVGGASASAVLDIARGKSKDQVAENFGVNLFTGSIASGVGGEVDSIVSETGGKTIFGQTAKGYTQGFLGSVGHQVFCKPFL